MDPASQIEMFLQRRNCVESLVSEKMAMKKCYVSIIGERMLFS